jgi:hypothetical protein
MQSWYWKSSIFQHALVSALDLAAHDGDYSLRHREGPELHVEILTPPELIGYHA